MKTRKKKSTGKLVKRKRCSFQHTDTTTRDNMNWSHLRLPVGALPVLRAKIGLITPTSDFQDSRLQRLLLAAAKKNQK